MREWGWCGESRRAESASGVGAGGRVGQARVAATCFVSVQERRARVMVVVSSRGVSSCGTQPVGAEAAGGGGGVVIVDVAVCGRMRRDCEGRDGGACAHPELAW